MCVQNSPEKAPIIVATVMCRMRMEGNLRRSGYTTNVNTVKHPHRSDTRQTVNQTIEMLRQYSSLTKEGA